MRQYAEWEGTNMTELTRPNARQLPDGAEIFLDHVGAFVATPDAASEALVRLGFTPTPISVQVNPDPAGGPPKLTGTGNVCAMLEQGYLELLFKTAETPLAAEFDAARTRYSGMHLAAFAVADAEAWHARLDAAGFALQPVVDMQRPVATADCEGVAAFSVVRLAPGQMAEGRIQMLRHRTEATVWQPRWLSHPNTAVGLKALTIAVGDVAEAAARYARFFGCEPRLTESAARFVLDRGVVELVPPASILAAWPGASVPSLPFMASTTIGVRSLDAAADGFAAGGLTFHRAADRITVPLPDGIGAGAWVFEPVD